MPPLPGILVRLEGRALDDLVEQLLPRLLQRMPKVPEPAPARYVARGEVAKRCGWPTTKAMEMSFARARKRGELHELERMAVRVDGGGRRWLESDVAKWIGAQKR